MASFNMKSTMKLSYIKSHTCTIAYTSIKMINYFLVYFQLLLKTVVFFNVL